MGTPAWLTFGFAGGGGLTGDGVAVDNIIADMVKEALEGTGLMDAIDPDGKVMPVGASLIYAKPSFFNWRYGVVDNVFIFRPVYLTTSGRFIGGASAGL